MIKGYKIQIYPTKSEWVHSLRCRGAVALRCRCTSKLWRAIQTQVASAKAGPVKQ